MSNYNCPSIACFIIMKKYQMTDYFFSNVLKKRPYVSFEICRLIIENPVFMEKQFDGRVRFWGIFQDKYLRVVTLEDECTIHNAFFDRGFSLEKRGLG